MHKFRVIICCSHIGFTKWRKNPRIILLTILFVLFFFTDIHPISAFSSGVEIPVTPWILPSLTSSDYHLLVIAGGAILLMCDAPFLDKFQPYVILRTGRQAWVWGQFVYIISASVIYVLFLTFLSMVCLFPNVVWNNQWGQILGTLAQTSTAQIMGYTITVPVSYSILLNYTPLEAMGITVLMLWLVCVFLGLVIFTVNLLTNSSWGLVLSLAFAVMDYVAHTANLGTWFFYLSPVSWAGLANLEVGARPSILSAVGILVLLCSILIFLSIVCIKKKDIQSRDTL